MGGISNEIGAVVSRRKKRPGPLPLVLAAVLAHAVALAVPSPVTAPASAPTPTPAGKDILILSGAQYGLPATDAATAAIVGRLKERGVSLNNIYFESLDLARIPEPDYPHKLGDFLKGKLRATNPGAVIVVGQPGMKFLAGAGSEIVAPAVPVVTTLVSQPDVQWKGSPRPTFVIPDRIDVAGTLRAALAVFPGTQRVLVVAGRDTIQRPYIEAARTALAGVPPGVNVEITSDLPYEEMLKRVGSAQPATLIVYVPYFQDVTGRSFVAAEVASVVGALAKAPVFAMFDTHLVGGVAGGSVVDAQSVGRAAAEQALDTLVAKLKNEAKVI